MRVRSQITPGSPSRSYRVPGDSAPMSPSEQFICFDLMLNGSPGMSASTSSSTSLTMVRANCERASRAARASDPDAKARAKAAEIVANKLHQFAGDGIEAAPLRDGHAMRGHRSNSAAGVKGPGVRTQYCDQARMNHLASLKAKDVDANNAEPTFLLGGFTAPMMWDRLAESLLKSNAVNSSVLGRKKTQGAESPAFYSNPNPKPTTHSALFCCIRRRQSDYSYLMQRNRTGRIGPSCGVCADNGGDEAQAQKGRRLRRQPRRRKLCQPVRACTLRHALH